jgi:predicted esterase
MKKLVGLFTIIIFVAACAGSPSSKQNKDNVLADPVAAYDFSGDIEAFLIAPDQEVEDHILNRLKEKKVSHDSVRATLKTRPIGSGGPSGLHRGLKLKHHSKTYSYALFAPTSSLPQKRLPLIVVLHGMGGSGDGTVEKWVQRLSEKFIVVCPTYPIGAWWSKTAEEIVLRLIQETQEKYPVDQNRIFLSGLSNGAVGAFMIGMNYPDYFAGIIPIAGGITERLMTFLVNLNNTPVYMIHGAKDPIFPVAYLRRVNRILSDMKYPVIFREHQESGMAHGGHFLPDAEIAPMAAWLSVQERIVTPRTIRMTREGNHLDPIFWVQISKGKKMAALQIPGPEKENLNIQDGKVATLFATLKTENRIEVMGKNLIDYEIYLNSEMIDFSKSVTVLNRQIIDEGKGLVPGESTVGFNGMVRKDLGVLLRSYKRRRDPDLMFDAVLPISLKPTTQIAWNR